MAELDYFKAYNNLIELFKDLHGVNYEHTCKKHLVKDYAVMEKIWSKKIYKKSFKIYKKVKQV